jgi:hypothetical protein
MSLWILEYFTSHVEANISVILALASPISKTSTPFQLQIFSVLSG